MILSRLPHTPREYRRKWKHRSPAVAPIMYAVELGHITGPESLLLMKACIITHATYNRTTNTLLIPSDPRVYHPPTTDKAT